MRGRSLLAGVPLAAVCCAAAAVSAGPLDRPLVPGDLIPARLLGVADFDRDGWPDLAVLRARSEARVLLGDGAGRFRNAASVVELGAIPYYCYGSDRCKLWRAGGDFNGDGRPDLALAGYGSQEVIVLLGGAGGLRQGSGSPVELAGSASGLTTADLNGDGREDIVVPLELDGRRPRVEVLLAGGSGDFAPAAGPPFVAGGRYSVLRAAVGDFNGDRRPDLAVADSDAAELSILNGDGTGGFGTPQVVTVGKGTVALATADFNRDGRADLAVARASDLATRLTVLLSDAKGRLHNSFRTRLGHEGAPAVGDVNGDGRLDLMVGTNVLLGDGSGGFRPSAGSPFVLPIDPSSFYPRSMSRLGPQAVAAADLNRDGTDELVFEGKTAEVGGIPWTTTVWLAAPAPPLGGSESVAGRRTTVFSTRGPLRGLAVDGMRAAASVVGARGSCGHIVVWTAPGRHSVEMRPRCWGDGWGSVALGDGQVAWIESGGGNTLELDVRAASLAGGPAKEVTYAANGYRAGADPEGSWVGDLVGAGSVLAYNTWRVACTHKDPDEGYCDRWGHRSERIVRIERGRPHPVASGSSSYTLVTAGGGRMAVEKDGAVTVLSAGGVRLSSVPPVEASPPRSVALSSTRLAVQRTFTLDLYDPASGSVLNSLPLGPGAALELTGVNANVALLRGRHELVLVRLSDGKLMSLPLPKGARRHLIAAGLSEAGLFYAYNAPTARAKGRVRFEPVRTLLARFGGPA